MPMSTKQQRIAIAEACGWIISTDPYWGWKKEFVGEQARPIPDYLNDLNVMHEAIVQGLTTIELIVKFMNTWRTLAIKEQTRLEGDDKVSDYGLYFSFKHLMPEAFLRTIGKWVE